MLCYAIAIHEQAHRTRDHEMRMTGRGNDEPSGPSMKRSRFGRDHDRDFAEHVALGQGSAMAMWPMASASLIRARKRAACGAASAERMPTLRQVTSRWHTGDYQRGTLGMMKGTRKRAFPELVLRRSSAEVGFGRKAPERA